MEKEIEKIIKELTLEEKISLLSGEDFWHLRGIERLNIPNIMVTDGPHGLRKQNESSDNVGISNSVPATCFPTASALASSWDDELIYKVGEHLAKECKVENVSVLLGPGVNIKRHPLCGRNFEYFSEDPILTGKLAASFIKGVQSKNIGTSIKHFVANNQETMRMAIDAIIDERTLRELYLKGFEIAIKEASPWTVMCSYNKVNGTFLSENKKLLNDVLKEEWKYKGLVMTDWGACNDRVKGLIAGQDLEMPGNNGLNNSILIEAINQGQISEELLNERVARVIDLILKSKETLNENKDYFDKEEHHSFARKVSSESIVLLKNQNNILPLNKNQKIALIGEFAKKPRYQGSGSSLINPLNLTNAYDAFVEELGDNLIYAPGYSVKNETIDMNLEKEAIEIASKADVVLIMAGLTDIFESEGFDRLHLNIPNNHNHLINEILKVNKNVIISLANGSPILMPWKDKVKGIIEQYLGGEASGEALADVVFGKVNPSGKLAETFPNSLEEFPSNYNFPGEPRQVIYSEGLYVGYRYYDTAKVKPLYPFGYGLSYTTFEYSNLNLEIIKKELKVRFKIKNIGELEGKEIAQIYISLPDSKIYRPLQELKGYKKVLLKPNESKEIEINVPLSSLEVYYKEGFKLESGIYIVKIGKSSENIVLEKKIEINSKNKLDNDNLQIYKNITNNFNPTKEDFEKLYGKEIPEIQKTKPYHINSVFNEFKSTLIGKMLHKAITKQFVKMMSPEKENEAIIKMVKNMVDEMPFRSVVTFSNGAISKNRAQGLIDLMNKRIIKGIIRIIKG